MAYGMDNHIIERMVRHPLLECDRCDTRPGKTAWFGARQQRQKIIGSDGSLEMGTGISRSSGRDWIWLSDRFRHANIVSCSVQVSSANIGSSLNHHRKLRSVASGSTAIARAHARECPPSGNVPTSDDGRQVEAAILVIRGPQAHLSLYLNENKKGYYALYITQKFR